MKNLKKMLLVLFPNTEEDIINSAVLILENKAPLYKVKTDLDMAMFLSQVREETGSILKPISESLNYTPKSLQSTFLFYRKNKELSFLHGRVKNKQKAKQQIIANNVYKNRLGNTLENDGWSFRGAGNLQITGRTNYENVQVRINRYDPNTEIDILNKDDIHSLHGSLVSALAFWIWKDLNLIVKKDLDLEDMVDNITSVINYHTHSYEKRVNHFNQIKHLV